jgi:hypothetical protein
LDLPKHGVQPSATWIAWMSSGFFIFPGVIPSAFAFIRISGIPICFSAIFVVGILLSPLDLSGDSIYPQSFSEQYEQSNYFLPLIHQVGSQAA